MKEAEIQADISDLLFKHPLVAWHFVTTTGKIKGRGGSWITLGFPGMSDIIGQLRDGRLFAIEVKVPGNKPTDVQIEFLDTVSKNGGVSGWCVSVKEALDIIGETI